MSFFTEDLLNSIKLRSFAPISQGAFDEDDLLALAYEELSLKLVSDLISVREDFFLTTEDVSISANISRYAIPSRAVGNALKKVVYVDQNSNEVEIERIDTARRADYPLTGSDPEKYYFEGDEIVLVPKPTSSIGSIRFVFPANPNQLVLTSACAKITGVSTVGGTTSFTVNTDLTSTLSVGDYIDFLSVKSPFKLWAYRVPVTQVTSTIIDVASTNVLDEAGVSVEPQVNDYICLSGTSNIPQIPIAFHPVLAQMVVVRLMESLGDLNKMARAQETLLEYRNNAMKLIKNRVESSPQKISTRHSLVRYLR